MRVPRHLEVCKLIPSHECKASRAGLLASNEVQGLLTHSKSAWLVCWVCETPCVFYQICESLDSGDAWNSLTIQIDVHASQLDQLQLEESARPITTFHSTCMISSPLSNVKIRVQCCRTCRVPRLQSIRCLLLALSSPYRCRCSGELHLKINISCYGLKHTALLHARPCVEML